MTGKYMRRRVRRLPRIAMKGRYADDHDALVRLTVFTDGVISAALILLAVAFLNPEDLKALTDPKTPHFLNLLYKDLVPLFAFVASFLSVCFFWVGHHLAFRRITKFKFWLMWWNNAFLLPIVLIPLATYFLAIAKNPTDLRLATGVYVVIILAAVVIFYGLWSYVQRRTLYSLLADDGDIDSVRVHLRTVTVIIFVASVLSVAIPPLPMAWHLPPFLWMLLAFVYITFMRSNRTLASIPSAKSACPARPPLPLTKDR